MTSKSPLGIQELQTKELHSLWVRLVEFVTEAHHFPDLITKLVLLRLSQRGFRVAEHVEQVHLGVEVYALKSAATIDLH